MLFFIQIMRKFQERFGPAMYKLNKGPDGKCLTDSLGTADKFCAVQWLLFKCNCKSPAFNQTFYSFIIQYMNLKSFPNVNKNVCFNKQKKLKNECLKLSCSVVADSCTVR